MKEPFKVTITERYTPFKEGGNTEPDFIDIEVSLYNLDRWERFTIDTNLATIQPSKVIEMLKSKLLANL